ncbi:glycosyltransferase family 2 protein [Arsenicibacter rosenii]|uniref:Glycosyltransferase 2-like domain-containing protein n=1 Tax=Arsenicibacter rosenii TaxID=1750698 RepID=A0A1S2VCC6_9BACT|nr:glycosyltransferase family 2 protein [Arsenicibacter rosenii]OIN56363.1 hypothetical protein BLX24_25380 [Arsenicibacter rosenii]
MEHKQFTIIVPTRERAEILEHTLRTCTTQDYENLTILVSDNYSQDGTADVINSFKDPRIKYINPGKRLSMTYHYEFALSHIEGGFVTILGDDDGLLPNAVETCNNLLNETGLEAVNMNYYHDFYYWPNHPVKRQASMLKVSLESGFDIIDAKKELGKVLNCKADYLRLPMIYSSFVSFNAINKIKKKTTSFFRSQAPDVYSGIALCDVVDKYVQSNKRLRLAGISAKSLGTSHLFNHENTAPVLQAMTEETVPFHERIKLNEATASISYIIAESLLQSFDAGLNQDEKSKFDLLPFIRIAVKEANTKAKAKHDEIIATTRYIAQKNNLEITEVEKIIKSVENNVVNLINYDLKRYMHPFILINASLYQVNNIYDACLLHDEVYKNPFRYIAKASTWNYMFQLVFGEFHARYR